MNVIDFDRNTYQYQIDLRFDCISTELVNDLVTRLLFQEKKFSSVSKEQGTGNTTLLSGLGTKASPLLQTKMSSDKINLWAGWYVSYEDWQRWRGEMLDIACGSLKNLPEGFFLSAIANAAFVVPFDRLKETEEIEELKDLIRFYRLFVPAELMKRASGYTAFADEGGKRILEVAVTPGVPTPEVESFSLTCRLTTLDPELNLRRNLLEHAGYLDDVINDFQSRFLSRIIKPNP